MISNLDFTNTSTATLQEITGMFKAIISLYTTDVLTNPSSSGLAALSTLTSTLTTALQVSTAQNTAQPAQVTP